MASYVNKKERVFCPIPDPQQCPPCELDTTRMRVQGRMKNFSSCLDMRAWHLEDQRRREHILESGKSGGCYPLGQVIPVSLLVKSLCPEMKSLKVCAAVEDYKKKHPEMEFDEEPDIEQMDNEQLKETIITLREKVKTLEAELVEKTKVAVEAVQNLEGLHSSLLGQEDLVKELRKSNQLFQTIQKDPIGKMAGIKDKRVASVQADAPLKVIQMQEESENMKQELQVLRACCECMSGVKGEAETIRAERDALREELEAIRAKCTASEISGSGRCFNLQTENEMLQANVAQLESQIKELKEEMSKRSSKILEKQVAPASKSALSKPASSKPASSTESSKEMGMELKKVSEERDRLQEQLESVQKRSETLDQERCRLQHEVNELKAALELERQNSRQTNETLKNDSAATRPDAKTGASNVADMECELAYLRPLVEKYEACQRDCEMYANGLKQMMDERENFLRQIEDLNKEINDINERNAEMVNEYEKMQIRTSEGFLKLRQEIEIKDDVIEMLQQKLCDFDPLQEELSTLQGQLVECIRIIDELQPSKDAIVVIEHRVGQIVEKLKACNENFQGDIIDQVIKQLTEMTNLKSQSQMLKSQLNVLDNQLQYSEMQLKRFESNQAGVDSDRKRFVQNQIEMQRCKLYDMATPDAFEIAENLQIYIQELNYVYGNCDKLRQLLTKTQEQLDKEGYKEEVLNTMLCFEKNKLREIMNEVDKLDKKLKLSVMKLNNFYDENMNVIAGMECSLVMAERENAHLKYSIQRDMERLENHCDELVERLKQASAKMIEEMTNVGNTIEELKNDIKARDKLIWSVKHDWHFQELFQKMAQATEFLIRSMSEMDDSRQKNAVEFENLKKQGMNDEERIAKLQNELVTALTKPCTETVCTQTEEDDVISTTSTVTTTTHHTQMEEYVTETFEHQSSHTCGSKRSDHIIEDDDNELRKLIEELRNNSEQNRNEILGIIANLQAQINNMKVGGVMSVAESASSISSAKIPQLSPLVVASIPGSVKESISVPGSLPGSVPGSLPGSIPGSILHSGMASPIHSSTVGSVGSTPKSIPGFSLEPSTPGSVPGSVASSKPQSFADVTQKTMPDSQSQCSQQTATESMAKSKPGSTIASSGGSIRESKPEPIYPSSTPQSIQSSISKTVPEVVPDAISKHDTGPVSVSTIGAKSSVASTGGQPGSVSTIGQKSVAPPTTESVSKASAFEEYSESVSAAGQKSVAPPTTESVSKASAQAEHPQSVSTSGQKPVAPPTTESVSKAPAHAEHPQSVSTSGQKPVAPPTTESVSKAPAHAEHPQSVSTGGQKPVAPPTTESVSKASAHEAPGSTPAAISEHASKSMPSSVHKAEPASVPIHSPTSATNISTYRRESVSTTGHISIAPSTIESESKAPNHEAQSSSTIGPGSIAPESVRGPTSAPISERTSKSISSSVHGAEPASVPCLSLLSVASSAVPTAPKMPSPRKSPTGEIGGFVSLFDASPQNVQERESESSMSSTHSSEALKALIAQLQSKVDFLTLELDKTQKALAESESKISRMVNSSNKNLQSLRNQYERTSNDMLSKHNDSVGRLQQMHEEALANQAREYEQQIENLKRQLDEVLGTRQSLSYTKTGDITIKPEKAETETAARPKPCLCKKLPIMASGSMLKLLHKMLHEGPETLKMPEIEFLHNRTLKLARDIREKERLSKLSEEEKMAERIKKMEVDLVQKQITAQEKLIELSEVVKAERLRLQTVRGTYGTEPNLIEDLSRQQQTRICRAATEATMQIPEKDKCRCKTCSVVVAGPKTSPKLTGESPEKCICKKGTYLCQGSICPADVEPPGSRNQRYSGTQPTTLDKIHSCPCTSSSKRRTISKP